MFNRHFSREKTPSSPRQEDPQLDNYDPEFIDDEPHEPMSASSSLQSWLSKLRPCLGFLMLRLYEKGFCRNFVGFCRVFVGFCRVFVGFCHVLNMFSRLLEANHSKSKH